MCVCVYVCLRVFNVCVCVCVCPRRRSGRKHASLDGSRKRCTATVSAGGTRGKRAAGAFAAPPPVWPASRRTIPCAAMVLT
jgi:hypothetical protein